MPKKLDPEQIATDILTYMRLVRKHISETNERFGKPPVSIIINKRILLEFIGAKTISDKDFNLVLDVLGMGWNGELRKISPAGTPDVESNYSVTLRPKPSGSYVFDDLKALKRYALATT